MVRTFIHSHLSLTGESLDYILTSVDFGLKSYAELPADNKIPVS